MKRNKLLLVLAIVVVVTLVLAGCTTPCEHAEYGDWTITQNPTTTAGGKASHKCANCDETQEVSIPALSDTSVWTKDADKSAPASHTAAGKDVYKSVYGEVEVTLPQGSHDAAVEVTVTTAPELNTDGAATYACSCGATVSVTLDKLSTTAAWTVSDVTEADYINDGSATYTHKTLKSAESHELITYTLTTPNLVAPYDGKTYNSGTIDDRRTVRSASVTLDEHGTGTGTGYPLNGENSVTDYNPTTGAITYTVGTTVRTGFVDKSTGIIVITKDNYATVELLSPYQKMVMDDMNIVRLDANTVVIRFIYKVNAEDQNSQALTIYASDDTVMFGVSVVDENNEAVTLTGAVTAANYSKKQLVVKSGSDVIVSYAKESSAFVKINAYTSGEDTLVVYANGTYTLGTKSGIYTAVEGEANKIDAYVLDGEAKVEHYVYTLNADGTYTAEAQTVSVTVNFDHGVAAVTKDMYVGCVVDTESLLAVDSEYIVVGIYTDADHEDALVNNTITATTTTLHVALLTNVSITLHDLVDAETRAINLAEGSLISAELPAYVVGTTKKGSDTFAGWYTDVDCTVELAAAATASASINDIYAKWEAAPAWTSKETAETIVLSDRMATIAGATTQDYQDYYAKLVVENTTEYTFKPSGDIKVLGTAPQQSSPSKYYGRYVILKVNDSQLEVVGSINSFGSNSATITLAPATYIIHIRCDDKVTSNNSSLAYNIWGEFGLAIYESNSTIATALDYTVGTEATVSLPLTTVYHVDLVAGHNYKFEIVSITSGNWGTAKYAVASSAAAGYTVKSGVQRGVAYSVDVTVEEAETYYLIVTLRDPGSMVFKITDLTASSGGEGESLAGKEYYLKNYTYGPSFDDYYKAFTVTFTSATEGTIKLEEIEDGCSPTQASFTYVANDGTVVLTVNGTTINATYTDSAITFQGSISGSFADFSNKTLTLKA